MDLLIANQEKIRRQNAQLIFIVYLLVMLNFLQAIFQSSLFSLAVDSLF